MGSLACGARLDDAEARRVFAEAAEFFVSMVERAGPGGWERQGLGEWSVRDLVGHTSRALITIETYLETRVFELVVHTLDLAAAIGVSAAPPTEPAAVSLEIAARLALRSGKAADALLALTGRSPLPTGFSVL